VKLLLLLPVLGALTLGLVAVPLLATPALAERPGASATATVHALDELANAIAQGKVTRTPTPTSTPTAVPTSTPVPPPADSPVPTATPDLPLPVPDVGQAVAAYVRPSPRDPSLTWLEVATPQGRWAVLYDTALCEPPAPWTNVWLALDDASTRPITAERLGTGMCALAQWSWTSDVPCAADGDGVCDAAADPAGWPSAADEPPSEVLAALAPSPLPLPTAVPAPRVAPAPPTSAPRMQVVVQTVVVTAVPTDTPIPEPTATPRPAPTSSPLPTATVAGPIAAATAPTLLVLQAEPSPTPATAAPRAVERVEARSSSNWLVMLAMGSVVLVAGVAWFTRGKRRYVL